MHDDLTVPSIRSVYYPFRLDFRDSVHTWRPEY
jgi:hypothetical protein